MEGYKVIKEFSFAEKGDVFTKVEDLNLWELQKSETKPEMETYTSMAFDSSTMDELAKKDYVIWFSEEAEEDDNEDECERCCDKLEKVKEYISTLIDTYTKDYNELMKDYNEGNVQQCVKVEAETVYHNLNKVLNSIKDLLDE
mgnify:FL=1|jgi:hypothetical protein